LFLLLTLDIDFTVPTPSMIPVNNSYCLQYIRPDKKHTFTKEDIKVLFS
jgi:hypothetical protein